MVPVKLCHKTGASACDTWAGSWPCFRLRRSPSLESSSKPGIVRAPARNTNTWGGQGYPACFTTCTAGTMISSEGPLSLFGTSVLQRYPALTAVIFNTATPQQILYFTPFLGVPLSVHGKCVDWLFFPSIALLELAAFELKCFSAFITSSMVLISTPVCHSRGAESAVHPFLNLFLMASFELQRC